MWSCGGVLARGGLNILTLACGKSKRVEYVSSSNERTRYMTGDRPHQLYGRARAESRVGAIIRCGGVR